MIQIKSNKIIVGEELFDGYVYLEGDKIVNVTTENIPCEESYDYTGKFVSPGFIDMHTHGAGGHDFMYGGVEGVIAACRAHLEHGTTCVLPTISTGAFSAMREAVISIDEAMKSGKAPNALGAHLEGPYFSVNQCGAQDTSNITPPNPADYERLVEDYGSAIKRWSYAPENDKDATFCKYLSAHGIIPSVGHSDAIYDDLKLAMANGLHLVTHLYSCTSTITRDHGFRRLGIIETAYLEDDMYVEIIADGKHLPPELLRLILKCKPSDKIALITDSMAIAGTDISNGDLSGVKYIVEDGVCKMKDRSAFAGSIATTNGLIRTMVKDAGCSVPLAVKMLTKVPAEILGVNKGVLAAGKDADIVVFDDAFEVLQVFLAGAKI